MRIMGLDVGSKTVGVAVSDLMGWTAQGVEIIRIDEEKKEFGLERLAELVKEYEVEKFVVGLPKNMNNTTGDAARRSMEFKERLEQLTNVPIILIDERLSTVEAENILLKNDMSRKKRKDIIDSAAAMIILDTYLRMESNYGKK